MAYIQLRTSLLILLPIVLILASANTLICQPGFYLDSALHDCKGKRLILSIYHKGCDESCGTCSDGNSCDTCANNYMFKGDNNMCSYCGTGSLFIDGKCQGMDLVDEFILLWKQICVINVLAASAKTIRYAFSNAKQINIGMLRIQHA